MSIAGVAGVLVASPDPARMRDWYARHLGLRFEEGSGARFPWRWPDGGGRVETRLDFVDEAGSPFAPGSQPFRVSYLVRDLDALARTLDEAGNEVTIRDGRTGRVGRIVDPEGRAVELLQADEPTDPPEDHGRVTGIGGVFLRSPDPAATKAWYARLGIVPGDDGYVTFPAISGGGETLTVWEVFPADTTYFDSGGKPGPQPLMLNLRVRELDELVEGLRRDGVWVDPTTEAYEYGKFAWIVDPSGARIELWEPAPTPG